MTYPLKQEFAWYQGSNGNGQASGAYVFRPETQSPISVATSASLTYVNVMIFLVLVEILKFLVYSCSRS